MPTTELARAAEEASVARPEKEVFSFEHAGKRYWLKRARATGSNPLHHLAWRVTKLPLLVPVARQKPDEALRHESGKLRRLKRLGIAVPEVLLIEEEYFIMEDSGPSVRSLLRRGKVEKPQRLYRELFELLGRLHSHGEYHGGSQVRNFTYRDGNLYLIDFEENFPDGVPIEALQFRDLFLLLFSLTKDCFPINYNEMIAIYKRSSGNDWIVPEIGAFTEKLSKVEKIIAFSPIWRVLDKDTRATYRLLQELKRIDL